MHSNLVVAGLHLTSGLFSQIGITNENPGRESAGCGPKTFVPFRDHMWISYVADRSLVSLIRVGLP